MLIAKFSIEVHEKEQCSEQNDLPSEDV